MKKVINILLLLVIAAISNGQNASEDFKKMNKFYLENNDIAMDIEYRFYENHRSSKSIDTQKALFKKSGENYFYQMSGLTTIQNNKYKLALHESNELLLVGNKEKKVDPVIFTGSSIDTALIMCKKIDFVKKELGIKQYTLYYNFSKYFPYSKVVVELNVNNSLSKLIYYYNKPINYTPEEDDVEEAPRFEIVYKNTSIQPISDSQFSLSKYVKIQGQKISPVSKYAEYRLINQLI